MNRFADSCAPKARHEDLLIEELGDETLVYDMRTHKAHCLNRTSALVWNRCDGNSTVNEMTRALEQELRTPVSLEVIWLALEQLSKARLLSDRLPSAVPQQAMTRRSVIRKIGFGAAVALPLVTSILAPTTAEASTCRAFLQPCTSNSQCCSNVCNNPVCG